jgi:hypothetical protein
MQRSTGRESSAQGTGAADSEATSKKTVSDLEKTEEDVELGDSKPGPAPSPDGALDRSDEMKDAGLT